MSGVVGKNEDRYSGQIAAVIGIETRTTDPAVAAVGAWTSGTSTTGKALVMGF